MHLETLLEIAEDGPWCGTRPPGHPLLHPSLMASWNFLGPRPESRRHSGETSPQEIFGPEPDPWRLGAIEVGLYGAIRLYQFANRLSDAVVADLRSAALVLFDETCGSVPVSGLIWLLLHRPPPPSPPWLNALSFAAELLGFAQAAQQHELARAASRQLVQYLHEFGLMMQRGAGAIDRPAVANAEPGPAVIMTPRVQPAAQPGEPHRPILSEFT